MNTFYVDESGSMTKKGLNYRNNHYFIICIVQVYNSNRLKRIYKRFVTSNLNNLKCNDKHQSMFYKNGKFKEIKGASLSASMKKKFVNFFCQNNLFGIYYICSSNKRTENYFYNNKARAFNYMVKLSVEHNTKIKNIKKDINFFYIDERNVKTGTLATLGEYLNTELVTARNVQGPFIVGYYQSEFKELIQIADVFANFYYSYIIRGSVFDNEIDYMRKNKYIKDEFFFPYN